MKVKYCVVWVLAVSLAGMALTYWYVTTRGAVGRPLATMETRLAVPPLITTARPTMRLFTLRVPWIGIVKPQTSVALIALRVGRVEAIETEDQAWIGKGELVVRLGGPQVEGQRAKLTAEVESSKSQLELAGQTVKRLKRSLKARLATKDQVAAAQDRQVKLASQLRRARLNLEIFEKQLRLFAPMSGTFTNRRISVGQDVDTGQVVGDIIDAGHLRIEASLFPPQHMDLQGKKAVFSLDENQTLTGLVRHVLPQASSTGAVLVWIEGPQINKQLRPGQTVAGRIVVETGSATLAVPASAIVYDPEERPYLFVQKEGAYEPRRVQLGLGQNGWVGVLSGLEATQSVVTQGAYELFYRQFNQQFKVED
jgi:RND family efflux transporter MFP subunit